jgi:hypothetical protein
MPSYTVLEKRNEYEIRLYEAYIVAETHQPGNPSEAMTGGFNELFRYITGENISQSKIAMTAPVLSSAEDQGQEIPMTAPVLKERQEESSTIAFIMPPGSTLETLPHPKSPGVRLKSVPAHKVAVISFSGYATEEVIEVKTEELLQALQRDGILVSSAPQIALYDPPWIPPEARRNEVMVEVDRPLGLFWRELVRLSQRRGFTSRSGIQKPFQTLQPVNRRKLQLGRARRKGNGQIRQDGAAFQSIV